MRYPTDSEYDPEFSSEDLNDEDIDHGDFADRMDLEAGDQYLISTGVPRDVVTVSGHKNSLTVTNPRQAHPQAGQSGTWDTSLIELYVEWRRGNIQPATLNVEADTPSEEAAIAFDTNAALQALEEDATDTAEFLGAVEEVVNTQFEQANIEFGCEFVHVDFPPAETGGEPAVKATFSVPEAGSVCKNGTIRVQYQSGDGEWRLEESEMLASDDLYQALRNTLTGQSEAQAV